MGSKVHLVLIYVIILSIMESNISQKKLILSYFKARPNVPIPHAEIVDWATEEWKKQTGLVLRDPDRAVRSIHQEGMLIKVSKGVYKYDGKDITNYTPKVNLKDVNLVSMYQDNHGDLWLGTLENGVFKYNGYAFEKFEPK